MREVIGTSTATVTGSTGMERDYGQSNGVVSTAVAPKKKICCACPSTKKLRDECVVMHGEEACSKWINAHKECLRSEGFKV